MAWRRFFFHLLISQSFYSGDCYIFQYTYPGDDKEEYLVGIWFGQKSTEVIAENLSEDEIAGLREMFRMIDTDNSGQITVEELKAGLERVGANMKESEIYSLMQAIKRLFCNVRG